MSSIPTVRIYARNLELLAFKRGWDPTQTASMLGVSADSFRRLRAGKSRFICADLLNAALELFDCSPNDLLLPQPGVDYSNSATNRTSSLGNSTT